MRFSVYLNPQTGGAHADHQVIRDVVEHVTRAEDLGLDGAFFTEHHFTGYNAYSDPLLMTGYVAARTSRLNLGFSVALPPLHHPVRLAEQISLLDVLCEGRLVAGLGAGGGPIEFAGYGLSAKDRHEHMDEALDIMEGVWTKGAEPYVYDTPRFKGSVDGRIIPASVRKPHPLVARGVVSEASIISTARRGWPVFLGRFTPDTLRKQLGIYNKALDEAGHDAETVATCRKWVSGLKLVHVADTHQQALDQLSRPLTTYLVQSSLANGADTISEAQASEKVPEFMDRAMIIGSPDEVVRGLLPYAEAGIEHVMLWMMFGQMDPRHIEHSLELFAREVMPALANVAATVG